MRSLKTYWTALNKHSELVVFDNLTAQKVWQKNLIEFGSVKFLGNNQYINFVQAFMMDGVKGTKLIGYLGDLYQVGADPTRGPREVLKVAAKSAIKNFYEYEMQIKRLEKAELSWPWLTFAKAETAFLLQSMVHGLEIAPDDLLI